MTQFLTTIPSRRPVWCRAALWLFGCALALPVAAVIMVFARHAVAYYRASELYAGD